MKFNNVRKGSTGYGGPIIMENGKVVNPEITVIESKAIVEGMSYVSRMTAGLSTGVLSQDEEYINLQKKIMVDLIKEQAIKAQKKLESEAKVARSKYSNAAKIQQTALDNMHRQAGQVTANNARSFYVNDDNEVYQLTHTGPIAGKSSSTMARWSRIDVEKLKKNINKRIADDKKRAKDKKPQTTLEKMVDVAKKKTAMRGGKKQGRGASKADVDTYREDKKTKKKVTKKKVKKSKVKKSDR